MPIHIPIYVNDRLIKTYHIGRVQEILILIQLMII
jgi:hypothetical protein